MQISVRELTAEDYPLWDKLVMDSPQRSVFAQRWWMDIVTQGGVKLLGCFTPTQLLAGLPIWPCTTLGVKRLRQPPLTPYWGPLFAPAVPEAKYVNVITNEMTVLEALAQALTSWPDVTMTFHPSLTNWLPFFWQGFTQTTRYTYRYNELLDWEVFERTCHHSLRHSLKCAQRNKLHLMDMVDPKIVLAMAQKSMQRQGLDNAAEIIHFWPALSQGAIDRNCFSVSAVVDEQDNVHTAYALVWDDRYAYGILGGGDPHFRASRAGMMAHLHMIKKSAEMGLMYDFEGSMLKPIEQYFRWFGGDLCSYLMVTRAMSWRLNTARQLQHELMQGREWLSRLRYTRQCVKEAPENQRVKVL